MDEVKKAYDVKELLVKFKSIGLELTETLAVQALEQTSAWVVESSLISKNPFDDIAAVVMPTIKNEALKHIDKIDGQVG
jgi:hypothetical protein